MLTGIKLRANPTSHQKLILSQWMGCARSIWNAKVEEERYYRTYSSSKAVFKIPAPTTSQECAKCGHTHPDNRKTQALFVCGNCGNTDNADHNASLVIKKRAINLILDTGTVLAPSRRAAPSSAFLARGTARSAERHRITIVPMPSAAETSTRSSKRRARRLRRSRSCEANLPRPSASLSARRRALTAGCLPPSRSWRRSQTPWTA